MEVNNITDLRTVMQRPHTIVLGLCLKKTSRKEQIETRKFLKRKSEEFPLLIFIYMLVTDETRGSINILKGPSSDYPKIYHVRNGEILVTVTSATKQTMNESFEAVRPFYVKEMMDSNRTPCPTNENLISEQILNNADNHSDDAIKLQSLEKLIRINKTLAETNSHNGTE